MNKATLKALKGSVAKWEAIVAGTGEDQGNINCPLCQKFNNDKTPMDTECDGCPVSEATGRRFCGGTPYSRWVEHRMIVHDLDTANGSVKCAVCASIAQKELDYLKSLLPQEEVK